MASNFLLLVMGMTLAYAGQSDALLGFKTSKSSVMDSSDGSIKVKQICGTSTNNGQITRTKIIKWLNDNLDDLTMSESLPYNQLLCLYGYKDPLSKLVAIIEASKPDACGDKHISMVEEFHEVHIEPPLMKYKDPNDALRVLPKPLKWFFIHYATELSNRCGQNFLDNLELMGRSSDAEYNSMLSGASGKLIDGIRTMFGSPETIEKHEDFLLVWNILDRNNRIEGIKSETVGTSKLFLKTKSAREIKQIQAKCRDYLKPIYHETALSSMRLIEMGYKIKAIAESPAKDKQFQNWYSIVQACEYLLPIEIYEDPKLELEEMIIMSKEEAEQLTKVDDKVNLGERISFRKRPAYHMENYDTKWRDEPTKLLKEIKSNLKSRLKTFRKVFVKSVKTFVSKSQLKKILISHKSNDGKGFIKTSAEPLFIGVLREEETGDISRTSIGDNEPDDLWIRLQKKLAAWGLEKILFTPLITVMGALVFVSLFAG